MAILKKGARRPRKLKRHEIDPETHVWSCQLYTDEVEDYKRRSEQPDGDPLEIMRSLLKDTLCDENGQAIYEQPDDLKELPFALVQELSRLSMEWSGMTIPKNA